VLDGILSAGVLFTGLVQVYIFVEDDWRHLGASTTGQFEVNLNVSARRYAIRLEFVGDNIHAPQIVETTLDVTPPRDWGWGWGIVLGIAVFAVICLNGSLVRSSTFPDHQNVYIYHGEFTSY
jgi:hypothetical protein